MRRAALILVGLVGTLLVCSGALFYWLFHVPYPPQPKFGFTGDWRLFDVSGTEERPLPPASEVWSDYSDWQPKTQDRRRLYVGRLGGAERQSAFVVSTNRGETPMGAQTYTHIDFTYTDPTNGSYRINWTWRGAHDPGFLKFDNLYRLYQLELCGNTNDDPPTLFIQGIEGMQPENYDSR